MQALIDNLMEVLQTWQQEFLEKFPQVIIGLIVFLISLYVAKWLSRIVRRGMEMRKSDRELTVLLSRITQWAIITLGILLALEQAGQDITSLIAGLGIVGFTIGFALQDVSANLVAGMLLLYQQPFDLGDSIKVSDYSGTVKQIDLRATQIMTFDGLLVMIPNKDIFTNTITNYTRTNKRRIDYTIGVSYNCDLEHTIQLILDALSELPILLKDPAPVVDIASFGDAAINLTIYFWYDTGKEGYLDVKNTTAVTIKRTLDDAGIEMPYPIQSIILQNTAE